MWKRTELSLPEASSRAETVQASEHSRSGAEEVDIGVYRGRAGAAFDRVIGNFVNGWVTAVIAAHTGSPDVASFYGGVAGPVAEEFSFGMRSLLRRQDERLSRFIDTSADLAGEDPAQLISDCLQSPEKTELLAQSAQAASRAIADEKFDLICKIFSSGALAHDVALVDDHMIALDAIASLEAPHVRLIQLLTRLSPEWWEEQKDRDRFRRAWSVAQIEKRDPRLGLTLKPLIAKLEALGIVEDAAHGTRERKLWQLTDFGQLCTAEMLNHTVAAPNVTAQSAEECND